MSALHICGGRLIEIATADDDRETRFCFNWGCRKHRRHTWALLETPPEGQPTYYEPVPVLKCEKCGEDHTTFPGVYRDGPAYPSQAVWTELVTKAAAVRETWDWDAIWERDRKLREEWADV